jgi:multidrug efflux pump subunit AcrA (membrane-fusion protein)
MKTMAFALSILCLVVWGTRRLSAAPKNDPAPTAISATPVATGQVIRANLAYFVSGPGKTVALESQKIVAPFSGTLLTFDVADGDNVRAEQAIGTLLSDDSVAALEGARQMLVSARTPRERSDARLALRIAKRSAVTRVLRSAEGGIVVSHEADEGARVAQGQVLVTIAAGDSIAFVAEIDQTHLGQIHAGLPASVTLAGSTIPITATVHAVLPAGAPTDLRSPVRIDLGLSRPPTLGVFGTAQIRVDEHRGVIAVPESAVLRNDVHGTIRIAVVEPGDHAKWIEVKTGFSEHGLVEILSSDLQVDAAVITEGQVGLPDGALIQIKP